MRGEFVDVSGVRLYYYAAGTRGAGDPVLLLHGFASSAHAWRQLIPRVPPGHRVIAVDLAGHGRSEPTRRPCAAAGQAAFMAALLDNLSAGAVHVVAHGFGCEVALALTEVHAVHNALLIAPAGEGQAVPALPSLGSPAAVALRLPWATPAVAPLRRHLSSGYTSAAMAGRSLSRHLQWFRALPRRAALVRQMHEIADAGLSSTLPSCALEILTGGNDPFTSSRRVAARFLAPGHGTLTMLGGERHSLPEEAPDAIVRLLPRLLGSGNDAA